MTDKEFDSIRNEEAMGENALAITDFIENDARAVDPADRKVGITAALLSLLTEDELADLAGRIEAKAPPPAKYVPAEVEEATLVYLQDLAGKLAGGLSVQEHIDEALLRHCEAMEEQLAREQAAPRGMRVNPECIDEARINVRMVDYARVEEEAQRAGRDIEDVANEAFRLGAEALDRKED